MKFRNAKLAKEKSERAIKMAEIEKARRKEAEAAKKHAREIQSNSEGAKLEDREKNVQRCIAKADLLQHLVQKQCYSRILMHRRIIYNIHKLNNFYGLSEKDEWGDS